MSLTEAERKRLYRQKQKAAAHAALLESKPAGSFVEGSFAAFVGDRMLELHENLDAFGAEITGNDFLANDRQRFDSQFPREEPLTALERATGLVDVFIDAAQELAALINEFKLVEVAKAIEAAEKASANLPRGDVEALRASFATIESLKAIQSELRRPTRHTFHTIRAKGEAPN